MIQSRRTTGSSGSCRNSTRGRPPRPRPPPVRREPTPTSLATMNNETVRAGASREAAVLKIRDEVLRRQRFLLTSHARPDGDSIGSQLAMAFALQALGKQVRIVNADPAPEHYQEFPGMDRIEIATQVE